MATTSVGGINDSLKPDQTRAPTVLGSKRTRYLNFNAMTSVLLLRTADKRESIE